ncbi:adenylyl-sulfate kinase [Pseudomonas straminea]|uniref:Predicted kinase n=1 Tax=Pseudomonas straminea TaxID=47882 RepID=A0A1I1T5A3_PSEOC|nr:MULTISPECIES: AAA family ATPase [Pseudomonas]TWE09890.1 putative kinase [Pseudomonas sp. AG1028]GLX12831.1 adenylyl-sulfate kinase [Pseudomonas straminea]SFD53801.1 Predicted kinase [Pseudomonas straminea]
MLIVFSGLPGTGKTTLAKALATQLEAVYLRIDSIEQALRNSGTLRREVGSSGYQVANAMALDNLKMGRRVIADCVNPVAESRQAWADTAAKAGCPLLNVQIICSDLDRHRQRVESRISDVPGLVLPDWRSVTAHEYESWTQAPLTVDTAQLSTDVALALLIEHVTAAIKNRA